MRKMLAGAIVAGGVALGPLAAMAPAQAAVTTQAVSDAQAGATATWGKKFTYHAPDRRGYFKGHWVKRGGDYYFGGLLYDRHRGSAYTTVKFRYFDDTGKFETWSAKTTAPDYYIKDFEFQKDFDIKVCSGVHHRLKCGPWVDVF
ncbi:hypothetical protein HNP84_005890 [Thermocatellispora tengchongensis]|uniref:Uncharacterized protein n=1 Tax=Thermocatellispora tengchongensis TaxID=1073253 RepID=A0A840PBT5_9ACTN|nr:hypothetical protein [Thermocatellispora tengchongensis]MBB5136146.1 hypothetical protein [Thermocatellispora tengchongensis]